MESETARFVGTLSTLLLQTKNATLTYQKKKKGLQSKEGIHFLEKRRPQLTEVFMSFLVFPSWFSPKEAALKLERRLMST